MLNQIAAENGGPIDLLAQDFVENAANAEANVLLRQVDVRDIGKAHVLAAEVGIPGSQGRVG